MNVTPYRIELACKAWWPLHWPKQFDKKDQEMIRANMKKALEAAFNAPEVEYTNVVGTAF